MTQTWTLTWVAGPDAGATYVLGAGSHIVGRAVGASVRCDDTALEPHHLLIEVGADGAAGTGGIEVTVQQLTGRLPVRLDGEPLSGIAPIDRLTRLEIGDSILTICPTASGDRGDLTAPGHSTAPANITTTPKGNVVIRRPRAPITWEPEPVKPRLVTSRHGESSGGLLPALLALGGAGLLALLLHQPMFLLFGAIGAVAAIGTWGGQRVSLFRRHRLDARARADDAARFERDVDAQRRAFVAHHLAAVPTPVSCRRTIEGPTDDLWARRGMHSDGFTVSIGLGAIAWSPTLVGSVPGSRGDDDLGAIAMLADLPLVADLGPRCRIAVRGNIDRTGAVVRALMLQLAASCGPADVRFIVVTHEPARWRWLQRLPHAATASGLAAVVTEDELMDTIAELDSPYSTAHSTAHSAAPQLHVVVVTDAAELLASRTSPLRRAVTTDRSTALVVLVDGDGGIPHVCTSLLDVSGPTHARWHADAALASLPVQVRWFGISERSATVLAGCLSELIDPEDPMSGAAAIPRDVSLVSLLPSCEPAAIAAAWLAAGVDPPPRTAIGVAGDGVVDVDLVRDGPHALLAGTTGAGKSELLRSLVAGLAAGSSPDHLTFVLIDYKGGATFDACADLPHVVGIVTDLDDHLANRALRSLHAELRRRERLLRDAGAADLGAYRRLAVDEPLPRLVVIIDEFATLVGERPDFLHALVGIAQRGRSLGVHLVLATQRPSGVISDDIRANTNLRLALRLHDISDALDVVGDRAPAAIPRGLAGRAVMRLGPDEVLTFQTARSTAPRASGGTDLDELVAAIRVAADLVGIRAPVSPWLAPLPELVPADPAVIAEGVVGLVDDPDAQRMFGLQWSRVDGHLLLVGAAGSGITSTLVLLAAAAAADGSGCHLYVIDGRGDPALRVLERSPACAGVVGLHERERLMRMVNRLGQEVLTRIADPLSARQPILVLVDGLDMVRAMLDELETSDEFEVLDKIVALGGAHDVIVVCTFDRVAAIPSTVLARCGQRWVFHLTDPLDAVGLGVAPADVPGPHPGRIFVTATGLEAQLAVADDRVLAGCASAGAAGLLPAPVECLPTEIDDCELPAGTTVGEDSLLPVGLRFDNGQVCVLDVPDGEHVLIVGPARSGRSTALHRIARAWRDAHPAGWWRVVAPRRTVFGDEHRHRSLAEIVDAVPGEGPALIAVDDAELVDDVGGAMSALAASRRHGLLIVAAGNPDSLRHSYGHWTGVVRRSRLGIVTSAATDLDGDLLGAELPRRLPIAARPGLVWVVSDGRITLTQLALPGRVAVARRSVADDGT